MRRIALMTVCLLWPVGAAAGPINIFGAQYMTQLAYQASIADQNDYDNATSVTFERTQSSYLPLHDTVEFGEMQLLASAWAETSYVASSALSELDLEAEMFVNGNAQASADSLITFGTSYDGIVSMTFEFLGIDDAHWSEGAVRLVDETTDTVLWSYEWENLYSGNVPWQMSSDPSCIDCSGFEARATIALSQALLRSHTYNLFMQVATSADLDGTAASIGMSISDVTPVAEPEPWLLLIVALVVIAVGSRHKKACEPSHDSLPLKFLQSPATALYTGE